MKLKISWFFFLSGFFILTAGLLLSFILGDLSLLKDLYSNASPGQVYTELIIWGASPKEIMDILRFLYKREQIDTFLKNLTNSEQEFIDTITGTIEGEKLLDGKVHRDRLKRLPFESFGHFYSITQGFSEGLTLGFFRGATEYRKKYPFLYLSYKGFGIIIALWFSVNVLGRIIKMYRRLTRKVNITDNLK